MPYCTLPDLVELEKTEHSQTRFYVFVGVLVSLSAGLERAWFVMFMQGSGLKRQLAVELYYANKSDDARREMTDKAMSFMLADSPRLLSRWSALNTKMKNTRTRNLVSHNPVFSYHSYVEEDDGPPTRTISHSVRQDPDRVAISKRTEAIIDFDTLKKSCLAMVELHHEIEEFMCDYVQPELRGV